MSFALKGADANSFGIMLPNTVYLKRTQEESYYLICVAVPTTANGWAEPTSSHGRR